MHLEEILERIREAIVRYGITHVTLTKIAPEDVTHRGVPINVNDCWQFRCLTGEFDSDIGEYTFPDGDEAQMQEQLRTIAAYCHQQYEALDADTVKARRYLIASHNAAKALEHLTGKRDNQIVTSMAAAKANSAAFSEWCRLTGRGISTTYVGDYDYARLLREAQQEAMTSAPNGDDEGASKA